MEDGGDNIRIAELNGVDEYGIELSYEVCKDSDGDNIEISADDDDGDWEDNNDYGGDSDEDNGDSSGDNGRGVVGDYRAETINLDCDCYLS